MAITVPGGKKPPTYYQSTWRFSAIDPPSPSALKAREDDPIMCVNTGAIYQVKNGVAVLRNAGYPLIGQPGPSIAASAKVRVPSGNFEYSDALLNRIVEYRGDSDAWCTLPPAADIAAFDVATAAPAFTVAQMGAGRVKFRTPGGSSVDIKYIEDEEEGDLYHTTAGRLAFASATLMQYDEDDGGRTLWVLSGALGPDA